VKLSVITPISASGNPYIGAAYDSLKTQTVQDFEWVILQNRGGRVPAAFRSDKRIKLYREEHDGIGALKRLACMLSTGDVIVELDHDDVLAPEALECVNKAALMGGQFIYSDFCEFLDGPWTPNTPYRADCGWQTYPVDWGGHSLLAHRAPPVTPQNLRYIDFGPNHLRAWERTAYLELDGHDPAFKVGDDHDLMVRFLLARKRFEYIPFPLYGYRVHEKNTVRTDNAAIRAATEHVFNRYIWQLAELFTDDGRLAKVDLCGGIDAPAGYTPYDLSLGHDLNKTWPIQDNSVGVLRAHDALEHLRDPVHQFNEAFRVLAPGGFFMVSVPSTNGLGAWCDPTHVSHFNRLSWRYYMDRNFARYVPEFKGRFALLREIEWYPSDWHRENNVPYCEAMFVALKPGYQHMGEVRW
jgi:O-antigen biosynthesis protein